jgi:hypothetical protein
MAIEENTEATGEGARRYKLLDRIAFKVGDGETIIHIDYKIDEMNYIYLLVILPWVVPWTTFFLAFDEGFGNVDVSLLQFSFWSFLVALALAIIPFAARRQFGERAVVNLVVFTDKAIYTTSSTDRKSIPEGSVTCIPWMNIKAYSVEPAFFKRRSRIILYTSYDVVKDYEFIPLSSKIRATKRLFESMLHQYHPIKDQHAEFLARKGASGKTNAFPISESVLKRIKQRRWLIAIIAPPADVLAFFVVQSILDYFVSLTTVISNSDKLGHQARFITIKACRSVTSKWAISGALSFGIWPRGYWCEPHVARAI